MLPIPAPHVVCSPVEGGAVLLSTADEVYFGLNQVGSQIWGLLPPRCQNMEDLCVALAADYPEVPSEQLREDVRELLAALLEHRLVVDAGPEGSSGASAGSRAGS